MRRSTVWGIFWKRNSRVPAAGKKKGIAEGFVSASLLFCVGAMTIVGSLQSGLTGRHETLFAKSMLDFVAAIVFASSLGLGVIFSAVFVLVYQGRLHWRHSGSHRF